MYLLDFMNSHKNNWQDILSAPPYSLTIKTEGIYHIIKYNMLLSDFTLPEVIEARGSIFRWDVTDARYYCVARALDKFANWQEPYAVTADIDWAAGVDVQEKVDGSLCKLWYDEEAWHLSTNGTIDSKKVECGDSNFYDTFFRVLGITMERFTESLDTTVCYWFELVSKDNPIVVQYKDEAVYYLGARSMRTMREYPCNEKPFIAANIRFPKHYTYHSLAECVEAAHQMGDDEEGYVVVARGMRNDSFLRVKVKGDEYLRLHKMRGGGVLTVRRVIELWTTDLLDDFVGNFPEYQEFVQTVMDKVVNLIEKYDETYNMAMKMCGGLSRKDAAQKINEIFTSRGAAYVFARMNGKVQNAVMYVFNNAKRSYRKFGDYIAAQLDTTEYGVEEEV